MVRLKIFIVSLSRSKNPLETFEFGQAHPLIETQGQQISGSSGHSTILVIAVR
jgi:hypothetical protein